MEPDLEVSPTPAGRREADEVEVEPLRRALAQKLREEFTRDIPNVSEKALRNLDDAACWLSLPSGSPLPGFVTESLAATACA